MADTKRKGDLGEAMIMADILRRGHQVALPLGEDWKYDLIVLRDDKLERVQCKYVESDGNVINIPCHSSNNWVTHKYTSAEVDWLACYDKTTDTCYYFPGILLGSGRAYISARLTASKNNQTRKVRWARDFQTF